MLEYEKDVKLGAGKEYICFDEGSQEEVQKNMKLFRDICHSGGGH